MPSLGTDSTIEIDDNSGFSSSTEIGDVFGGSFDVSAPSVDTTHNDDNGWVSRLYGNREMTGSFTCRFDPADSGQNEAMGAADGQTLVYLRIRPTGNSAGDDQWHGQFLITSYSSNPGDNAAPVDITFNFESTGSITHDTV